MSIQIHNKQLLSRIGVGFAAISLLAGAVFMAVNRAPITKADAINNTDFVITVDSTKAGSSTSTQFTIPTTGTGYNYTVDCNNDGAPEATGQTGDYTCTFPNEGTHTVRIGGTFPRLFFNNSGDKLKLSSVDQWGTIAWASMDRAFFGAENMDLKATDTPDLSNVTTANGMFRDARSLKGETANWDWNLGRLTNLSSMFSGARQFNQNLGGWDVSNITNMGNMFANTAAFNNGGSDSIKNWNTGKLIFADGMFASATAFNQPIGSWNMSSATSLRRMFYGATAFNQSLADWRPTSLAFMQGNIYSGAAGMLDNTALSRDNYDATLIAWDALPLKNPVTLGAAGLKYCRAEAARAHMTTATGSGGHGWTIEGDSKECPTHTLTFDAQSGTPVPPAQTVAYGATATEPAPAPTRTGYTFDGWHTATDYATKWNFATDTMPDADKTLYAKWTANQHKVQYQANTGSGAMADTVGTVGQTVQIAANTFTKPGYTFTGWNTEANGSGTAYAPGANYVIPASDLVLYAQWADQAAPAAPAAAPDMTALTDSGDSDSDNLTNNQKPSFTVTCTEAGSTITLYVDGVANGTVNCAAPGSVTITPANNLADGPRVVTYTEKDGANNESPKSPELTITVDTQNPAEPTITIDSITPDNTINALEATQVHVVSGTVTGARENDTVTITVNNHPVTVVVDTAGKFQVPVAGSDLVDDLDKTVDASVTVSDPAGNTTTKTATKQYSVDTAPLRQPQRPVLTPGSDTGADNTDLLTNDTTPTVILHCHAATDKIHLQVGGVLKTINCTASGPNEVMLDELPEGRHTMIYRLESLAGNVSEGSPTLSITVDTTAPVGAATDVTTKSDSPALIGTVDDASAAVEVSVNGKTYAAINKGDGTWELAAGMLAPALQPGDYTMTVRFIDRAGNEHRVAAKLKIEGDPANPGGPVAPGNPNPPAQPEVPVAPQQPKPGLSFDLADTGMSVWLIAATGIGLLGGGGWLIWRRKRNAQ